MTCLIVDLTAEDECVSLMGSGARAGYNPPEAEQGRDQAGGGAKRAAGEQ